MSDRHRDVRQIYELLRKNGKIGYPPHLINEYQEESVTEKVNEMSQVSDIVDRLKDSLMSALSTANPPDLYVTFTWKRK